MKICITGGAGFIGSHVADAYLAEGHQVFIVDNLSSGKTANVPDGAEFRKLDINDAKGIQALFESERFDAVNHHAAQISVPDSVKDPVGDAEINVLGLLNVLRASADHGVRKFIFISSGGTVYGNPDRFPCVETDPFSPTNPYGITKATGEFYVRFFGSEHGLAWTTLRYSNVYGPRQDPHGEAGVVAIFSQRILRGEPMAIFGAREPGDGGCLRDYVYVGDVARANVAALTKGDGEAFNIGTAVQTKTQELITHLKALAGKPIAVSDGPPRPGDMLANSINADKAGKILGWAPAMPLAEGLKETFDFFKSQA